MTKTWSLIATLIASGLLALAALANPVDLLQISAPRAGSFVEGPDIVVSGYGNDGTVTVQVFKGSKRVYNSQRSVKGGRWRTAPIRLGNGTYSATVQQGKAFKSSAFTVGASRGFGFTSPANGDHLTGPNVTFRGTADSGNVSLRVYRGSNLVFHQDVAAKSGQWIETRRMADGNYRATAERSGVKRTIAFHVGNGNPGDTGGGSGLDFDVEYPRNGSTVDGPSVTFSGVATVPTISIRLYDGDTAVYQGAVEVHNGRWSMTRRMSTGAHAVVVQQKEMIRTSKFNVRFGGNGGGTVKPSDKVAITSPPSGRTVIGPRVTFVGTANTASVGVNIYRGSQRVFESSQKVGKGRWTFTTSLKSGSYRVEVTAGNGRASTGFKVK